MTDPIFPLSLGAEGPTWVKECRCGRTIERWRGDTHIICSECGASWNAAGQRLRDDWSGNLSNFDDEVGDMEGYENQYAYDE